LVDRITISSDQVRTLKAPEPLQQVQELSTLLGAAAANASRRHRNWMPCRPNSGEINEKLWEAEDQLRNFEARAIFGEEFVGVARSVYRLNDQRSSLKERGE